jgi:predicted nucleic acid-binding protein
VIVADVSLIAGFALDTGQAELADAVCRADAVWAAPLLWRSEFRNVLGRCLQAGLTMEAALLAWEAAEEIMGGREYRVSSAPVLELAWRSKCPAWDCEYVVLARDLDVPLVTADRRILRAFPKVAVSLEQFGQQNL